MSSCSTKPSQPLSLVLTLDASGSMKKREPELIEAARTFVGALRPEDALAVALFSDTVSFAHDLSTKRSPASRPSRSTGPAAERRCSMPSRNHCCGCATLPGRRVLVVMTDGRDENNPGTGPGSTRTLNDAVKELKESGATVFTIGLGTNIDAPALEKLATMSGGRALFPENIDQLRGEFQRVVEDLRRRYVVGFTSSHVKHDGAWRDVKIRLKSAPEVTIQSSGGYQAPAK